MMRLDVVFVAGKPLSTPLSAEFDETGGTVGRAPNNQLVLPDPERRISRLHATVVFRGGRYFILDQGHGLSVFVNGRELGNGAEAPLGDGDELRIGDYTLRVSVVLAKPSAPGFEPSAPARPEAAVAGTGKPVDDPLALFGAGSQAASDPFADLLKPAPAPTPGAKATPQRAQNVPDARPPEAPEKIPDDFDVFAEKYAAKPLSAAPEVPAKLPQDLDLGISPRPGGGESIDALFDLTPGNAPDLFGPGGPLGEPASQPNTAGAVDPLAALGSPQKPGTSPVSDQVPELHGSFQPPTARSIATPPPEVPAAAEPAAGGTVRLSREEKEQVAPAPIPRTVVEPRQTPAPPPEAKPAADSLLGMFGEASGPDVLGLGIQSAAAAVPARESPPPVGAAEAVPRGDAGMSARVASGRGPTPEAGRAEDALLQAFLSGLGTPQLRLPNGLTPELMQLTGILMRELVQGALDLLLARAVTKREVRADVTMIVGRDNNPLKFSPNVDVALMHLLSPQGQGLLPPVAAVRDAYDDLRSHTFGFMAGMRAALAGALARFSPEQLEQRLTQKTLLDNLLPMTRKSKLWELFHERYLEISREAEEDFHALFGREFLRAYEEQVKQFRDKEGKK